MNVESDACMMYGITDTYNIKTRADVTISLFNFACALFYPDLIRQMLYKRKYVTFRVFFQNTFLGVPTRHCSVSLSSIDIKKTKGE